MTRWVFSFKTAHVVNGNIVDIEKPDYGYEEEDLCVPVERAEEVSDQDGDIRSVGGDSCVEDVKPQEEISPVEMRKKDPVGRKGSTDSDGSIRDNCPVGDEDRKCQKNRNPVGVSANGGRRQPVRREGRRKRKVAPRMNGGVGLGRGTREEPLQKRTKLVNLVPRPGYDSRSMPSRGSMETNAEFHLRTDKRCV